MASTRIEHTYGNSLSVAIANTNLENVLNATKLPKNSIIVNMEYDNENGIDVGYPSMSMTDYEGNPFVVTRCIEEKNGLHSDASNPNLIYMHIDEDTIVENNSTLSLNIKNIVDDKTLFEENGKIAIDTDKLEKASTANFGVMKVDNDTIVSDNGMLHVATSKLDYANGHIFGVAKGDGLTIMANNGVLAAKAENFKKASDIAYGVLKPDNTTIVANNGVLSIDKTGIGNLAQNGLGFNKADNVTILQNNGILYANQENLPIASNNVAGVVKIDQESLQIGQNDALEIKNYDNMFAYVYDLESGLDAVEQKIAYIRNILDNGQYQSNLPTIKHVSCNETTTTMLASPKPMEEPINMDMQHVYVSLNVITNCDFSIDIDYENNETPTVELDNINYNDEYTISGVDAIEHVWESTNMQEKNIILLFDCKNFLSSTGPKTKTTKLNITVSAKDNSLESKTIVYSIIRYNSYFIEDSNGENDQPTHNADYVIDEKYSKWIYIKHANLNEIQVNEMFDEDEFSETTFKEGRYFFGIVDNSIVSTLQSDFANIVNNNQEKNFASISNSILSHYNSSNDTKICLIDEFSEYYDYVINLVPNYSERAYYELCIPDENLDDFIANLQSESIAVEDNQIAINYLNDNSDYAQYFYAGSLDDVISSDKLNEINNRKAELYVYGVYKNTNTNELHKFIKQIRNNELIINTNGTFVYELEHKVQFDILYYKIKYCNVVPDILIDNKQYYAVIHQQYKDCPKTVSNISFIVRNGITYKMFMVWGDTISNAEYNSNAYEFKYDDNVIASLQITDGNTLELTSYMIKNDINVASIYIINNEYFPSNDYNNVCNELHGARIFLKVGMEKYETNSYLYINSDSETIKDKFEFTYSTIADAQIKMHVEKKYNGLVESYCNEYPIKYTTEYYSLFDNNKDIKDTTLSYYDPASIVFNVNNIENIFESYYYLVNYNIYNGNEIPYYKNDQTASFILNPVSRPQIYVSGGFNIENDSVKTNNNATLKFVHSINGSEDVNDLVDSITLSYLYKYENVHDTLSLNQTSNALESIVVNSSLSSNMRIKAVGIRNNGAEIVHYPGAEFTTSDNVISYTFNVAYYKNDDMLLLYSYDLNNESIHSNAIGYFSLSCEMPSFDLMKSSPIFIDGTTHYAYYCANFKNTSKNNMKLIDLMFDNYSYMSYNRMNLSSTNKSMSYSEKYLYSAYTLTNSYLVQSTPIDTIPVVSFNLSNFADKTYFGYMNNDNKIMFNIGTMSGNVGLVSLNAQLSCIVNDRKYTIGMSYEKIGGNLLAVIDDISLFEYSTCMFMQTSGYALSYETYYNSKLSYISYDNSTGQFMLQTESNKDKFYDDAMTTLVSTIAGKQTNIQNDANLKLEIYGGKQLAYSVVALENNVLVVNENRTNVNCSSLTGLLKLINTNASNTVSGRGSMANEMPIAYIHNIPNILDGFDKYCSCDVYYDYFIPRFSKCYDKHFTPYEYEIVAYTLSSQNHENILNKKVMFADEFGNHNKAKPVKVKFEVLYKNTVVFDKVISVVKETNLDSIAYTMVDYKLQTSSTKDNQSNNGNDSRNNSSQTTATTYFAYSYYAYSSTNMRACSQLNTYMDVDHYANLVFGDSSSNGASKQSINHGLMTISLNSSNETQSVALNTHEELIDNSVKFYLTRANGNDFSYVWQLSSYIEPIGAGQHGSYVFSLCEYKNQKLNIVPSLDNKYSLNKINAL